MKIFVKAKPNSRVEKIEKISDNIYMVWVKELAEDGKANEAIIKSLAEYFNVTKSSVSILSGHTSKTKIIEINK